MTKRKGSQADKIADKQPEPKFQAYVVQGDGSDDEIGARCAAAIPSWAELTAHQQAETIRLMRGFWERKDTPRYEVAKSENGVSIGPSRPEAGHVTLTMLRLTDAMASGTQEYLDARLGDLGNYHGKADRRGLTSNRLNADLAFVTGGGAKDTVQSTLLVQMAATHDAAMRALANIGKADFTEHVQLFGNLSTKLLGLYTRQAEVLAKLQREGTQTIKHVHIDNRGGQAVVAEQFIKGGSGDEQRDQSHALGPTMLGQDPQGYGVPGTLDQGPEAVPDAQRAGERRSKG